MSEHIGPDRRETIERNLWAAPAMFVAVSWALFQKDDASSASTVAWIIYTAGWIPALGLLVRSAAQRRNPGVGAVFAFGLLVLMGLLFWANHG
ncbi:hypothetical protein ACFYW6_05935 [Streptomyces sp. NPDC002659]|uniref:hypothetical protein n=1 Tax=unclassified Streptomyces TaxID=2593676 RepID=UPI002D78340F|nr:hypothetical protein [Streptomyces sp.]WSY69509.1 hypothetical protein OHA61_25080 [Streptomyces sp. NBC_00885]WSY76940.1 hypothetical protein OH805_23915 [Streptomyces sp. NBC_00879]HET6357821.1 hypothetical protein [Streptomyces sp.]